MSFGQGRFGFESAWVSRIWAGGLGGGIGEGGVERWFIWRGLGGCLMGCVLERRASSLFKWQNFARDLEIGSSICLDSELRFEL